MADGDIVDYLLGLIFKFFGWLIRVIVKFAWLITVGLVTGIIHLIKNLLAKKSASGVEQSAPEIDAEP